MTTYKEEKMEDEIVKNLDLLLNMDTLEQQEIWDEALDSNSALSDSLEPL